MQPERANSLIALSRGLHLALSGSVVASMFDENLPLDFGSEVARDIYQRCLNFLLRTRWYVWPTKFNEPTLA